MINVLFNQVHQEKKDGKNDKSKLIFIHTSDIWQGKQYIYKHLQLYSHVTIKIKR